MTASQTTHLIEQFSAQAPFALWITDSRGIAIFANHKLHEMFGIPEKPSGAIGMNIFDEPGVERMGLKQSFNRLQKGEVIDETFVIPDDLHISEKIASKRSGPMTVRLAAYPLLASSQKIEHYVLVYTDMTATTIRHTKRRTQIKDIEFYNVTKKTRQDKEDQLKAEVQKLEDELRALGGTP